MLVQAAWTIWYELQLFYQLHFPELAMQAQCTNTIKINHCSANKPHTVISIGRSPRTSWAPMSSDTLLAARNYQNTVYGSRIQLLYCHITSEENLHVSLWASTYLFSKRPVRNGRNFRRKNSEEQTQSKGALTTCTIPKKPTKSAGLSRSMADEKW